MYTLEQLETVKQEYLDQVEENKKLIDSNKKEMELLPIRREVSKRVYEKYGKSKNYSKKYDEHLVICKSHIQEFIGELEVLELKIDIINKMINEVKQ